MITSEMLEQFPRSPGVYIMKDGHGKVIYVGKAKNLKQRVKQYFVVGGDGRSMIPFLISKVETIDTIVVLSEKEALLLENTLIKNHQPTYNALLKDDKTYISLKITTQHQWPMVQLVRYKGHPKRDGLYFGPYTSATAARQTLDLINRIFPLRQCSDQELLRRDRPCILYQMKRCIAPCVELCTKEEYERDVQRTIQFLRGQNQEILQGLYREMEQSADKMEYEHAADILRMIRYIETTIEQQSVHKVGGLDMDVWGVFRQAEEVVVTLLLFRHGKLIGAQNFEFSSIAQADDELLDSFLLQFYEGAEKFPHEILLPIELESAEVLSELLSSQACRKVQVLSPQRGEKKKLLEMAFQNAEATFTREKDAKSIRERTLMEMKDKLRLIRYPKRIDCLDNSHLSGSETVSAVVTFLEGVKDSKGYRTYKIRMADAADDYGALREVLVRRYQKAKEENNLPDLLMIDGGKGHLNVAQRVFEELDIASVDLIGIAKEMGRHDKGMTVEKMFLVEQKDPVELKATSPVLYLLQQIRDEAHRFVLEFQKKRRSKAVVASELDGIPGIGPKKIKLLLKRFGSVRKLKEATSEELHAVKGISSKDVQALLAKFGGF